MKNPEERNTKNREDMMCTRCNSEGLEPHPAYIDEYEGRYALLKATRCTNEDCEFHDRGVPEDKIEIQLPEKSLLDSITNVSINKDTIYAVLIILGGAVFIMMQMGIGPFAEDATQNPTDVQVQSQINGEIVGGQNISDKISSVELHRNGSRQYSQRVSNGTFSFNNVNNSDGTVYKLIVNNEASEFYAPSKDINMNTSKQEYNITVDQLWADRQVKNINQSLSDGQINIEYQNKYNIRDVNLIMSPIKGDIVKRDWPINTKEESSVLMPNFPSEQRYRINASVTEKEFSESGIYQGSREQYEVFGNKDAEEVQIQLLDVDYNDTSVKKEIRLPSGSSSQTGTIDIRSNETLGNATLTIKNGTAQTREQKVGRWNSSTELINVKTGVDEYVDNAQLRLTPKPIKRNQSITGLIDSNNKTHNIKGNGEPVNATISFNGGDASAALRGTAKITDNASNGTKEVTKDVTTIQKDGSYRIEWENQFTNNNQDLVNIWYRTDSMNNKQDINSESGNEVVDISSGENVEYGAYIERDTVADDSDSPSLKSLNDNLEVVSLETTKDNPQPNENVEVKLTLKNNGITDVSDEIEIYQNGELFSSVNVNVPGGEKITLGGRDIGVPVMGNKGTNVWFVSDRGPFFIEVGGSEPRFGSINSEINIRELGSQGKVNVSLNGNSECNSIEARNGECDLSNLKLGENKFRFEQSGVRETEYNISYQSVQYPRDVVADFGNDGFKDVEHSGVLNDSITETVELPPKNVSIDISNENQIPLDYSLTWDSNQVIDGPVIDMGGDFIVRSSDDSFVQSRTYDLGRLNGGEHIFRLQSASGGYTAVIEWNEQQDKSLPEAIVDGQKVCDSGDFVGDETCTITDTGVSPGNHNINFLGPQDQFNYRVVHNARAVANSIDIQVDDRNTEISRPNVDPKPWEVVESTEDFRTGNNVVNVDVESVNNINPNVDISLEYQIDTGVVINPQVTVIDGKGNERNININQSAIIDNELVDPVDINIPREYFTEGLNRISLKTQDGVYKLNGDIVNSNHTSVTFSAN